MNIPFEKIISIIHNPKFSGLPTHYPSLASWDIGNFDISKYWAKYKKGKEEIGIYVNIPFCKTKCKFCFLDVIIDNKNIQDLYIDFLVSEFKLLNRHIENSNFIKSVYIGGGTPNILSAKNLEKLLENLHRFFNLKKCSQITIESNPDFWDKDKISILKRYGVNLVIMGIQSFNTSVCVSNLRSQKLEKFEEIISLIKKSNIKINLDILLGISNEEEFFKDVKKILDIMPEQVHINRLKPIGQNFNKNEKEYLINLQNRAFEILAKKGYKRLDEDSAGLNGFKGNIQGNPDFQIYSSIIAAGLMSLGHIYGKIRYQNTYDLNFYINRIKEKKLPVFRYCQLKKEDEIVHYCLNKILRDKIYLSELQEKFDKKRVKFILKKLDNMKGKGIINFKNASYFVERDINWYEITKNLYSEEYLIKIARRYRLIK